MEFCAVFAVFFSKWVWFIVQDFDDRDVDVQDDVSVKQPPAKLRVCAQEVNWKFQGNTRKFFFRFVEV